MKLAEQTARDKGGCVMLGSIIHNAHVVQGLAALGARQVDDPAQVQAGDTVIIRSHGEKKQVYQQLEAAGASIVDATCPNVRRIQRLVAQAAEQGGLFQRVVSFLDGSMRKNKKKKEKGLKVSLFKPFPFVGSRFGARAGPTGESALEKDGAYWMEAPRSKAFCKKPSCSRSKPARLVPVINRVPLFCHPNRLPNTFSKNDRGSWATEGSESPATSSRPISLPVSFLGKRPMVYRA